MDSMRHLSTSLPNTRKRQDQPGELMADFRAAALSVTNLYKSAAASQEKARAAGYQDALDDLLAFLDRENLGLMDGEGWRVRRWATEKLVDDGTQKAAGSDDGDDTAHEEQRSASPEMQRKQQQRPTLPPSMSTASSELAEETTSPLRRQATSEPPRARTLTPPPPAVFLPPIAPAVDDFTFRSTHPYPTNHDRDANQYNMDLDSSSAAPSSAESVRIISRPTRGRHTNHQRQRLNGNPTISLNVPAGVAGGKRKLPYQDFFDISGFNGFDRREGGEGKGGKRGRYV